MPTDVDRLVAPAPVVAAPRLLGWDLTTRLGGVTTTVRLSEVEAYGGADDPASHAARGRTERNGSMFLAGGHLYVYRSYGIHVVANIVTGADGEPGAVLLRGAVPVDGMEAMAARRGRDDHLTDGPGRLGEALGLTLDHDGAPIGSSGITLTAGAVPAVIDATPRIGITRATERRWRFVVEEWAPDAARRARPGLA